MSESAKLNTADGCGASGSAGLEIGAEERGDKRSELALQAVEEIEKELGDIGRGADFPLVRCRGRSGSSRSGSSLVPPPPSRPPPLPPVFTEHQQCAQDALPTLPAPSTAPPPVQERGREVSRRLAQPPTPGHRRFHFHDLDPNNPYGYVQPPPFRHNWDTPNRARAVRSMNPVGAHRAGYTGPPIGSRPRPVPPTAEPAAITAASHPYFPMMSPYEAESSLRMQTTDEAAFPSGAPSRPAPASVAGQKYWKAPAPGVGAGSWTVRPPGGSFLLLDDPADPVSAATAAALAAATRVRDAALFGQYRGDGRGGEDGGEWEDGMGGWI
ncbi:uncharacterized protein THITE_116618 [Thermothielavioides terrestris NRRL 8126]|uniref:Uncharacterized protein n=1 Tax=Thermothielavioides terrestris (strain ATCC 38088 / NRRL 8126) TaxID=578455 RepID=G2RHI7_THETT|nr:uncharacterized protein THITE_116618 [Thermothielavioides terrestris NRRL 8126]AEO71299.1 hypothetical protein THITE_116618 [Thermothielavioides terrestris NRRL 8126]